MATKNRHREAKAELAYTCKKATSLITDYVTGTLAPDITRELERHLSACSDCAAFLKTYKKTIQMIRFLLVGQLARNGEIKKAGSPKKYQQS